MCVCHKKFKKETKKNCFLQSAQTHSMPFRLRSFDYLQYRAMSIIYFFDESQRFNYFDFVCAITICISLSISLFYGIDLSFAHSIFNLGVNFFCINYGILWYLIPTMRNFFYSLFLSRLHFIFINSIGYLNRHSYLIFKWTNGSMYLHEKLSLTF